jgi:hypothetical protein
VLNFYSCSNSNLFIQNSARFKSLGSGIGAVAANFSRHGKKSPLVTLFLKKNGKLFQ